MKRWFLYTSATVAMALASSPLQAQFPLTKTPPPPWINSGGLPPLKNAEVLPDKRITFRFEAPKADSVSVSVGSEHADLHVYPMTKGADGIWSVTIPSVPPEIYPYRIQMGGVTVRNGLVDVPGNGPAIYDVQNVPHGSYTLQDYSSKPWAKNRTIGIYLPAAYYSEPNRRFPVLYYYDNPKALVGGMNYVQVMDNLIAQKKAKPMIVVFMIEDASSGKDAEGDRMKNVVEFQTEIMPMVDRQYRTIADRDHRAMGGISHNAGATWTTSLHSLDKLSYVGMLSSGMFGGLLPRTTGPYPFALYASWEPDKVLPGATKAMLQPGHQLKLF